IVGERTYNGLSSAKNRFVSSGRYTFMRRVSPGRIHDVGRREWKSLPLGGPSECSAVVVEAAPSAISDLEIRAQGWNEGALNCNEPSTILRPLECELR